jgi:hypothetical protein
MYPAGLRSLLIPTLNFIPECEYSVLIVVVASTAPSKTSFVLVKDELVEALS